MRVTKRGRFWYLSSKIQGLFCYMWAHFYNLVYTLVILRSYLNELKSSILKTQQMKQFCSFELSQNLIV